MQNHSGILTDVDIHILMEAQIYFFITLVYLRLLMEYEDSKEILTDFYSSIHIPPWWLIC